MAALHTVIARLDELLEPGRFRDFTPNGLHVPPADAASREVRRVVTGVSANEALLRAAVERDADLVLCHHGMFWRNDPLGIDAPRRRKLALLLGHDVALLARQVNLFAYHLPLDAHLTHGNNALLARAIGAERLEAAFELSGTPIGVVAHLPGAGIAPQELAHRIEAATAPRSRAAAAHLDVPGPIRTVGIVVGAGAEDLGPALALGVDAFVTGEAPERAMHVAVEHGLCFVAAGHHDTERLGVQALGALLADELGVEHEFVDVPNPL